MVQRLPVSPRPEQLPSTPDQTNSSERLVLPERPVEHIPSAEQPQEMPSGNRPTPASAAPKPTPVVTLKSPTLVKIEEIMEEDLADAFIRMQPEQQLAFKRKGEQTARQVEELLQKTKVKIRKVVALLLGWLKLLPGANRFFVEQEAKIKAEKIINLKNK